MSSRAESPSEQHDTVQALLPRLIRHTLDGAQLVLVQAHLDDCADCRADLAWQRRLVDEAPAPLAGLDPERALARLMPQLGSQPAPAVAPPGPAERLRRWWQAGGNWMPWALAGQTLVIGALAFGLARQEQGAAAYRVLGNADTAAAGNMVVIFRPQARLADVRRLMDDGGARVVDGPTVTGAYVLTVDPARQARTLAALRADPAVELAEPLTPRSPP